MWTIKFLSGPNAGKEVFLQKGLYILGRDPSCKIQIVAPGVSKKHAQLIVNENGIRIEDLNSSNGTFLDGKQIQTSELQSGTRVALHTIILEVKRKELEQPHPYLAPYSSQQMYQHAPHSQSTAQEGTNPSKATTQSVSEFKVGFKNYLDNVVLPGIYKLAEWTEFRWVIGGFIVGFIFLVMAFSSVPLIQILKSSVEQESRNHAESIATTVAKLNRKHLEQGLPSAITMDYALRRPGVKEAYIINALNGQIVAPVDRAHTYPKNSFVHKARKLDQVSVEKINASTLAAVIPIRFFNQKTGDRSPTAYSVIVYDMGVLTVGNSKIISLFIQNLFIASLLGLLLFFFFINLIEFPLKSINSQFYRALKDDKSPSVSVNYQSEPLKDLCSNINSALNQISLSQSYKEENSSLAGAEMHRQNEMDNLVEIIGFPSLAIQLADDSVASVNSNFKDQMGLEDILHQPVQNLSHSALKEHLSMLLEQGNAQPHEISFGEIELKGNQLQTTCQFVMGNQSPAYAIITFVPVQQEDVA